MKIRIVALAHKLPAWAAALIVAGVLFAVAGIVALVGRGQLRRATPATLTGVNGRPTSAWAVEIKLSPPGLKGPATNSSPPSKVTPASRNKLSFFNIINLHLPS